MFRSVLQWLKEKCTQDAGSYVLVRERNSSLLKLYDLSELYEVPCSPYCSSFQKLFTTLYTKGEGGG